jgi:hypothetical protein
MNDFWGHTVLILGSALLLALVAIASFPCWPHSRRFGYGPSASAAVLLVLVAILAISHKPHAGLVFGGLTAVEGHDDATDVARAI